jgi:ubiquinone/menaquinone biosynthesis C-methylase UbiE
MSTELTLLDWHARYEQQAHWTKAIRRYLYSRVSLGDSRRILDVGCGTGVLENELQKLSHTKIFGVDIAWKHLEMATRNTHGSIFAQGDAHTLPFQSNSFEIGFCHYLLLWVANPLRVVQEMRRVVIPGGAVLALAEPDYGGRIDYPPELSILGEEQRQSLRRQGADPEMGRKLASIFRQAGLASIEFGVLGGQWHSPPSKAEWESEWHVLENDLSETRDEAIDTGKLKALDWSAWQRGERVLFVPTFYALGFVPHL